MDVEFSKLHNTPIIKRQYEYIVTIKEPITTEAIDDIRHGQWCLCGKDLCIRSKDGLFSINDLFYYGSLTRLIPVNVEFKELPRKEVSTGTLFRYNDEIFHRNTENYYNFTRKCIDQITHYEDEVEIIDKNKLCYHFDNCTGSDKETPLFLLGKYICYRSNGWRRLDGGTVIGGYNPTYLKVTYEGAEL